MSVDTHLTGKNLQPYRTMRLDGVKVLVTTRLSGLAESMVLDVKGRFRRRLVAVLSVDRGDGCDDGSCRIG